MLKKSDLDQAQNDAIDHLFEQDHTLLLAKMGFGKCVVSLTAAVELIQGGHLKRVLVLAPLRTAQLTWGTEPAVWEHTCTFPVTTACGTPKHRTAACESGAKIVVTNFENVAWMLEHYGDTFDGLIIDEITKLKSVSGTAAKKLRHWVRGLKWRVGLTGSTVAEAGGDIYGQALLLDCGAALGTRKESFKRHYMYPTDFQEYKWEWQPGGAEKCAAALSDLIYLADDRGYQDSLPPIRDCTVLVDLPEDGQSLYNEMARHSVVEAGEYTVVAESAALRQLKLQQIAQGGLYHTGDDGARTLAWSGLHKRDVVKRMVAGGVGPVIIVYQLEFELKYLTELYPDAPVLGQGRKFTAAMQDEWNRGEHPVLLMHPKSAAHGLNFQHSCNRMIFLGPVWGADPWAQTIARIRRRGQPKAYVERFVLVTPGTVDEEILDKLAHKEKQEEEFMAAVEGQ